jgi:peptide/nickel transport system substrate-binding protein
MLKKLALTFLVFALIITSLLTACSTSTSTSSSTTSTTSSTITTTTSIKPTTTTSTTQPTTSTTSAKWWDSLGVPQYGGSLTYAVQGVTVNFDVQTFVGGDQNLFYETLFQPDWTLNRSTWAFNGLFTPDQYWIGNLAKSWEQTDPVTITVHLQQGVKWQDKPPVNGREFTAYDVQAHYERLLGIGPDNPKPSPVFAGSLATWQSVTATDNYTVIFKFKSASANQFQSMSDRWAMDRFEAPEWVKQGDLQNWENAVGTGPFVLTNFISGSSYTYVKNPTYWGTDPRWPNNKLPYLDQLSYVIIADPSTKLAAMRSGKVDIMHDVVFNQAADLLRTNPEVMEYKQPAQADGIVLRLDKAPFTDIRVRIALQQAIDNISIAKNHYGGSTGTTVSGILTQQYKGFVYAYADWPQSLKDEYSYNLKSARQLLTDAGYPNGFDTNVVASATGFGGTPNDVELLEIYKAMFSEIGVNMTINMMSDTTTLQAFLRAGKHDQMGVSGGGGVNWPPTRAVDLYYSKGVDALTYGLNSSNWSTYDDLRNKWWAATTTDQANSILIQMDKFFIEQHTIVRSPEKFTFAAITPKVGGYSGEIIGWGKEQLLSKIWAKQ